jgi:hypothetical protein
MAESTHHLLCNDADAVIPIGAKSLRLEYRPDKQRNIRIALPGFVQQLLHVPPRLLDLLKLQLMCIAQIDGVIVVGRPL